jgi:hypothetical protein
MTETTPADVAAEAESVVHDVATDTGAAVTKFADTVHPAVAEVLQFFDPSHLREDLAVVARPFQALAHQLAADLHGSQLTIALHNLLASKDAAVRAKVSETASAS